MPGMLFVTGKPWLCLVCYVVERRIEIDKVTSLGFSIDNLMMDVNSMYIRNVDRIKSEVVITL